MFKNKISYTAAYIVVKFYGLTLNQNLSRHFPPLIVDFYEKMLVSLPPRLRWYHRALQFKWLRRFFIFWEELLLPGDLMHIVCRKYYITRLVDSAISSGYTQMVILGSGFDHLGYYAAQQGVTSFELDVPSMSKAKHDYFHSHSFDPGNLHFCPLDVNMHSLSEVLKNHPDFDMQQPTIFIGEGFFDYLSDDEARSVIEEITRLCPDNTLISTIFSIEELNAFYRWIFTFSVKLVGEKVALTFGKSGYENLLLSFGYSLVKEISSSEMENDWVRKTEADLPVLKGFYVIEGKRGKL